MRVIAIAMLTALWTGCSTASDRAPYPANAPSVQAGSAKVTAAEAPRLVAIGDLHGDLSQARAALRLAGLIDDQGRWAGGTTIFVQTGDVTDRGPDSKAILDLLMALEPQAKEAGGEIIALLGNHEVMNMIGDLRYVHPGDTAAFGGPEARSQAFSRDGAYGEWLLDRPIVAKVGRLVFAHGGITETWAQRGLVQINREARESLLLPAGKRESAPVLGPGGPLWYRGFAQDPEAQACPHLQRSLDALDADVMVVGHTAQRSGTILSRCEGRLHVIDIGIGSAYGGNLGAWSWSNGMATAIYPTGTVTLPSPSTEGLAP